MTQHPYTFNLKTEEKKEEEEHSEAYKMGQAAGAAIGATLGALIFAPFIVWAAWNFCMPALFGLPAIGYLQSVALYVLFKILF